MDELFSTPIGDSFEHRIIRDLWLAVKRSVLGGGENE
jgi:hypothetical protein